MTATCERAPAQAYVAQCAQGAVGLEPQQGASSALDAALSLPRLEQLLALLDAWAGAPLDWQVSERPAPAGAALRWRLAGQSGRLQLPWPLLARWGAPPRDLAPLLDWAPQALEWELALAPLTEAECRELEPGGLLLLPPGAPVRLRAAASWAGEWCWQLAADGALRPAEGQPAPATPARLRGALAPTDVPTLMGWRGGALQPEPALTLWQPADRLLARGRLCAWPAGQALAIETTGAEGGAWT